MNEERLYKYFEKDFYIGAAVSPRVLKHKSQFVANHFNSITAENQMKFEELQPKRGEFQFDTADKMVQYARDNGLKMRGHTLVWHNQTPDWVFTNEDGSYVTRDVLLARMEAHIKEVVTRYKDDLYCWDVVNEAIDDKEGFLRQSKWLDIIGEDFIEKAFRFAHQYAPNAQLFYNDYNAVIPEKRERIYKLLKSLVDQGAPIHGMGIQGHWNIYWPNEDEIRKSIELYASLGLKIQITELDISMFEGEDKRNPGLVAPTKEMLKLQEEQYERIFKIFKEYRDVITAVTFWGVADDYSWLDYFPVFNRKNWPLIFDEKGEPKESYRKIIAIK